jgi:Spy/CpxP family protein refolding chaperone
MMKKMMCILFLGMTALLNSPAFARSMESQCEGKEWKGKTDREQSQCPIANKFMMKVHFLLEHKTDIGLTDDQVKTIKDLELQMEKEGVRQTASMDTFLLDLQNKLSEDKVDIEGANVLIDKAFASASASTKSDLEEYARLKNLLTPDQVAKMKALHEQMKKNEKEER